MNQQIIIQPSFARTVIHAHLSKLQVGGIATYEEIGELTGKDIGDEKQLRHLQNICLGVRWKLLKEAGFYIDNIEKVGYKRVTDEEALSSGQAFLDKTRRNAKKASRVIASVDYGKLNNEQQIFHNVMLAQTATVLHFTSRKISNQIESQVVKNQGAIPILETLDAFKGS